MVVLRKSELHFLIFQDREGLIVLSQALVKPGRDPGFSEVCIYDEMYVLMKDQAVHLGVVSLRRQRDVVHVLARLKKTCNKIVDLTIGPLGLKRPVRRHTLKNDHVRRYRICECGVGKQESKSFSKLL